MRRVFISVITAVVLLVAAADTATALSEWYLHGHWATTGASTTVDILCGGTPADCQTLADVAAGVSAQIDRLDLRVVGYATPEQCDPSIPATEKPWGYITYCMGVGYGYPDALGSGRSNECNLKGGALKNPGCDDIHIVQARVWLWGSPVATVVSHELQHALGLCDDYVEGCEQPQSTAAYGCLTATSAGYLNERYDHDDGFTTAQPASGTVIAGANRCTGGGGSPTPTPSPTPTVQPTPEATPKCNPGWRKQGRC